MVDSGHDETCQVFDVDVKTQSEQDVYERQIRAMDEQIDSLVYELYGLNEEEIKIVTSKTWQVSMEVRSTE